MIVSPYRDRNKKFFIDYICTMSDLGLQVSALLDGDYDINKAIPARVHQHSVNPLLNLSILKKYLLSEKIAEIKPDIILCFGDVTISLLNNMVLPFLKVGIFHEDLSGEYDNLDYIICANNYLRQQLTLNDFHSDKIFIIENMIYVPPTLAMQKFEWYNKKHFTIGSLVKDTKRSGIKTVIQSISLLRNINIKIFCIISAPEKDHLELQRLLQKNAVEHLVDIIPYVTNKKEFFEKIDIFIVNKQPSHSSIPALEGFMFCIPTILSDIAPHREISDANKNCILVSSGEPSQISSAIEYLATNPRYTKNMVVQAFQSVTNNFNNINVGKKIYFTLEKIWNNAKNNIS